MLNTQNFHSDLKATFTYLLTGYEVLFGGLIQILSVGRLFDRCFKQGTKRFNTATKKNVISNDKNCYEIYSGYTELQFFTKPIKTDCERTVQQSYSTALVHYM